LPEVLTSDAANEAGKPADKLVRAKKKRMKKD
jgi:hypothetical protein